MKIPQRLLVKLSPLVEAARGEPLIEPFVEITENSEQRLVLMSSYGAFVFDRLERRVTMDDSELAPFDAIQSVDISAFPGGLGERSWSISLYRSVLDRTTVARTYDDGEASTVAARVAGAIGCRVVTLVGRK